MVKKLCENAFMMKVTHCTLNNLLSVFLLHIVNFNLLVCFALCHWKKKLINEQINYYKMNVRLCVCVCVTPDRGAASSSSRRRWRRHHQRHQLCFPGKLALRAGLLDCRLLLAAGPDAAGLPAHLCHRHESRQAD